MIYDPAFVSQESHSNKTNLIFCLLENTNLNRPVASKLNFLYDQTYRKIHGTTVIKIIKFKCSIQKV